MDRSANSRQLLDSVLASFESTPDARLRQIIGALVRHLHQFVAEVQLDHDEWQRGIEFLTAIGQKCSTHRQEFMLLSDVLGVSSAVDVVSDGDARATPGTVLGPYYIANSPRRSLGESLIDTDDGGPRLRVHGVVRDVGGKPIPAASLDVWSCATNGLYPAQDPNQAPTNLRGLMSTDASGRFEFIVLRPHNYSIPMDGPVGDLMRASSRSPMRAAHVHLIITAPGYQGLTTHLFDSECEYLASDSVFSTRAPLIRQFQWDTPEHMSATFDVTLTPLGSEPSSGP
jgi:catechol 1,2-dioxygenase